MSCSNITVATMLNKTVLSVVPFALCKDLF